MAILSPLKLAIKLLVYNVLIPPGRTWSHPAYSTSGYIHGF